MTVTAEPTGDTADERRAARAVPVRVADRRPAVLVRRARLGGRAARRQHRVRGGRPVERRCVLLSGTIAMSRKVGQDDVETVRTDQRGVYGGAMQSYLKDAAPPAYTATVTVVSDARVWADQGHRLLRRGPRLVPDGDPPAGGPVLRDAQLPADRRSAPAAARARRADGGPDPRAEQPGRRCGPRELRAAGTVRRDAEQARDDGSRGDRPAAARGARRRPGAGRAGGRARTGADADAGVGARGRAHRVAGRARRRQRVGAGAGVRLGGHHDAVPRQAGRGRRRRRSSRGRCAGCPTPSRPSCCSARSPTRSPASPPWSTRRSSTRTWTARRSSGSTCTSG